MTQQLVVGFFFERVKELRSVIEEMFYAFSYGWMARHLRELPPYLFCKAKCIPCQLAPMPRVTRMFWTRGVAACDLSVAGGGRSGK